MRGEQQGEQGAAGAAGGQWQPAGAGQRSVEGLRVQVLSVPEARQAGRLLLAVPLQCGRSREARLRDHRAGNPHAGPGQ